MARSGVFSKRALVTISHVIERAALAEAPGEPMVVCALFQRLSYFERERAVYRALANRADVTVVGLVDEMRANLPAGITSVLLRPDEDLAREWAIVVLTPSFGAALVATDQEELDEETLTLEPGRLFRGRWGTRRDEAYAEIERLVTALGNRLPPSTRGTIETVLRRVNAEPQHGIEPRAEAAIRHLVTRLERVQRSIAALREQSVHGGEHDPQSGLYTEQFLRRWTASSTSGTLPLGLILLEVPTLAWLTERYGRRASANAATGVGEVLRREARRVDRAIRLTEEAFLLAQPTVTEHQLLQSSGRLSHGLASLECTYPFVALEGKAALLVSRQRPLPLAELRGAVEQLRGRQESVTVLAG
ncbi:MAG: DICT sensory domain-containing protein [Sciscionella sp.]